MRWARLLGPLAVLAVAAAGCSYPGATTGPITLTATFNDVGDLVVDHSVQVADVRVGSVTKIELTPDFKAKVTMQLKDTGLPADSVAELRTTSLLGEKFIELRPCDPKAGDTGCQGGTAKLTNGEDIPISRTQEAPELEFVADQAVQLLGGVAANDIATLVQAGSEGFGGRGPDLRSLVDSLATISSTLAGQSNDIATIIDGLDKTTSALAGNNASLDQLLVNLAGTTKVLADNRDQLVSTLKQLTRLVTDQDQIVFQPYLSTIDRQVKQVDAILQQVAQGRSEVGLFVDWLQQFIAKIPLGVPGHDAQVYGWFNVCPGPEC